MPARTCQAATCVLDKRTSQRREAINYSKRDNQYLHGSCRGRGKPYSHGKRKENREWHIPLAKAQAATARVVKQQRKGEEQ